MRAFGLPVLHFFGELALHPHHRSVVVLWQRLTFQFRPALDRAENFRNVFRHNEAIPRSRRKSSKCRDEPTVCLFQGSLGEATENSPRFQPWEFGQKIHQPRRGERAFGDSLNVSVVPPGLDSLGGRQPSVETLGYFRLSLRDAHFVASSTIL